MSASNWPIVLIEVVLIFGGTLAFAWWQLRSVRLDQEKARRERADRDASALRAGAEPAEPEASPSDAMRERR